MRRSTVLSGRRSGGALRLAGRARRRRRVALRGSLVGHRRGGGAEAYELVGPEADALKRETQAPIPFLTAAIRRGRCRW